MNSRARALLVGLLALLVLHPSIVRGQGFSPGLRLDLTSGTLPTAVAFGDLNNDGKLDLTCANATSGTVSVWLGDGRGGYGAKTDFMTCTNANNESSVAIGDLNGDGRPDLVVTNSNQDSLVVLLGNGLGGFPTRKTFPYGGFVYAVGIAVGDLNNDGKPDVVTCSEVYDTAMILYGDGAGNLGTPVSYNAGTDADAVVIGDVNNDGRPDLVVSDYTSSKISVMLATSAYQYLFRSEYATGTNPYSVAIGDLNGDGKLDAVTTNYGASSVSVLMGDGTGAFTNTNTYAIGSTIYSTAIGDLNGDGKPDLAVANSGASVISVLIGDGTGAFGPKTDFATGFNPADVAIADLNGDGRADIVTAVRNAGQVSVFFGIGSGIVGPRSDSPVGLNPEGIAAGDLNGDGRPDLVEANTSSGAVSVMLNTGSGGFSPKVIYPEGMGPTSVAFADMNGDGKLDVAVSNFGANQVQLMAGNGGGGLAVYASGSTGTGPNAVAVGDLNGDGKPDVATVNFTANTISVLFNQGAGTLGPKTDYATGTSPSAIALADVNGDGRLDIIATNYGSNTVSVFANNGGGSFAAKADFPGPPNPSSVAAGDMNGDGWPDLVVTGQGGATVRIYTGSGTTSYNVYYAAATGTQPTSASLADVNGDGRLDVVVSNYGSNTISMLLGAGTGQVASKIDLAAGTNPQAVTATDLNGDGRADIAAVNYGSNTATVYLALELTRTTLATNATTVLNSPIQLTASVSVVAPVSGAPSGTVSFFDGKTLLGTSAVTGGAAALWWSAPRLGNRPLTAVYNGDGSFFGSISATVTQKVVSTAKPMITLVHDVTNDQGRQVRTRFRASPFDCAGSGTPIVRYDVFRQVNPLLSSARPADGSTSMEPGASRVLETRVLGMGSRANSGPAGPARTLVDGWDFVGSTNAFADSAYDVIVPTVADSNGSGIHRSVFFVRAVTSNASLYYDSPADSGYSVDNIAPVAPSPFTAAYQSGATNLHWGPNSESDFWYYRVYRGSSSGFTPGPGNLIATRSDTGYADVGPAGSYYKLSATDRNGNESLFATLGPNSTLDVEDAGPVAFALEAVRPNPTRGRNLTIRFALPSDVPARLELMDVSGRRIIEREVGSLGPGSHAVDLSAQRTVPPGLYLVRLTQGLSQRITRVTVLE